MKIKSCLLASAALPLILMAAPAAAQSGSTLDPPVFPFVDEHGVDLPSGHLSLVLASISIGPGGPGSLGYNVSTDPTATLQQPDASGRLHPISTTTYMVVVGGVTETFTYNSTTNTFTQDQGRTSTLTASSSNPYPNNIYTYTDENGVVSVFSTQLSSTGPASYMTKIVSKTYPSGETLNYYYVGNPAGSSNYYVQAVTSSLGYQMRYTYAVDGTVNSVVLFNMHDETCDPAAASCTLTGSWPSLTIDNAAGTVTDSLNHITKAVVSGGTETITFPDNRQVTYSGAVDTDGQFFVNSYSDGKGMWNYTYTGSLTTVTNPDNDAAKTHNYSWATTGAIAKDQPDSSVSLYTQYDYDPVTKHLSDIKLTNGSIVSETDFGYDVYGRVTLNRRHSSTDFNDVIDLTAGYLAPANCNPKYCNKPSWTKDANSNQTDYTYNPSNGAVASVTLPPATAGGNRSQIRYNYAPQAANFRNGSGVTITGSPAYRLTSVSQCQTTARSDAGLVTCSIGGDEIKTTISYDANQAILPTSSTGGPGDLTYSSTTTTSYYPTGDVKTVDGPVPGTGDTTRFYYDAMRQNTGIIGPDPDGATTTLKYRASRTTFDAEGRPALIEAGTATGQGDGDMGTFVSLQQQAIGYDGQGRKASQTLTAGGTTYQLTQIEYTSGGALKCTAVRMNLITPPSLACTQSSPVSAQFGADLITQYAYDPSFRVTSVTTGVGTSSSHADTTNFYGPMGELQSVADAKNNLTTYEYDGFYRLAKTRFPNTSGGGSSTTDFEQLTHDAVGNVTQRTTRAGTGAVTNWLDYVFDGLNRVKTKTPHSGTTNPTSTFQYDLIGRMTSAVAQTAAHTVATNFGYGFNAQGPYKTDTSVLDTTMSAGQKTIQSDVAGRRTQLKWGDGFYVTYDYDNAGEMTAIRESGSTPLETFAYDDLGRRISRTATPANGTSVAYGYDGASNMVSLSLNGGSNPVSINPLTYSPAGQIMARTANNDIYAWTGAATANPSYVTDGQNKYTSVAGVTQGYDLKGNLNSANGVSYTYGIENALMTSGSTTLLYDAFGRLVNSSVSGRFDYDGDQMISEATTSGGLLKRYVFGPGVDEPLVWYEGTGTGSKRYLDADERGSIIRVTDGGGATLAINSYDEYGTPATTNSTYASRFRYTGQAIIPELGMYYYKARFYSATLGRFMQPDPIGYGDGMNMYNYVHGDPINGTDTSGLEDKPGTITITCTFQCTEADINKYRAMDQNRYDSRTFSPTATSQFNPHNQHYPGAKLLVGCTGVGRTMHCGTPEQKKIAHCRDMAWSPANTASFIIDLASVPPGGAEIADAVRVGGAIISTSIGAFYKDNTAVEIGGAGGIVEIEGNNKELLSKRAAQLVPGLGSIVSAVAVVNDLRNVQAEYDKCMGE